MAEMLNTFYEYTFEDGEKVKMTLQYYALYQLKGRNKKAYDEYNRVMARGISEELDMITVIYTAYLCANAENECMDYESFMIRCGSDRLAVKRATEELIRPKKR